RRPQLGAGLRIEGSEPRIVRRSNEHQSAAGRDAAADITRARFHGTIAKFAERFLDSKRRVPGDVAGVDVERYELPVRRRPAWNSRAVLQHIRERSPHAAVRSAAAWLPSSTSGVIVLMSFRVIPTLPRGPGFCGKGCVGHVNVLASSLCGTLRSSMA